MIEIPLVVLISTLIHRTLQKCLTSSLEDQEQKLYLKGRNEDLQKQSCLHRSAVFMCVLDCPLADGAVTALTFHQKGKPLPIREYAQKMVLYPTNLSDSPSHLCHLHC